MMWMVIFKPKTKYSLYNLGLVMQPRTSSFASTLRMELEVGGLTE